MGVGTGRDRPDYSWAVALALDGKVMRGSRRHRRHNDYGHPAPSTMTELSRLAERVYRTDRDGDIAVVRTSGGLAVVTKRG
jgi:hypothetical protein